MRPVRQHLTPSCRSVQSMPAGCWVLKLYQAGASSVALITALQLVLRPRGHLALAAGGREKTSGHGSAQLTRAPKLERHAQMPCCCQPSLSSS